MFRSRLFEEMDELIKEETYRGNDNSAPTSPASPTSPTSPTLGSGAMSFIASDDDDDGDYNDGDGGIDIILPPPNPAGTSGNPGIIPDSIRQKILDGMKRASGSSPSSQPGGSPAPSGDPIRDAFRKSLGQTS